MPKLLVLFVASMLVQSHALADSFYRNKQEYSSSKIARDIFGTSSVPQNSPGIDFGNIEASVSTKMDCGRIDIVTNFEAQFKKIREQAEAFVKDIDGYMSAAPMLATCYMMPQVCALIRHDHFSFTQNLNLRAQACAAIDRYIDNQAEKGAKQLEADAKRNCVESKLNSGGDMASATSECSDVSGMPLRDLSDGLRKKFASGPQRVLKAMLSQVGEQESYSFLASVLGEIEIQNDGYWQPLWPHRMLKPNQIAANMTSESVTTICSGLMPVLASTSVSLSNVKRTIREKLNTEDADNLDDLSASDRKLACTALGRAVAKVAVEKEAAKKEAIMTTALTNGALPEGLKEEYRRRSSGAFETLRLAVESEQIPALETVRTSIRELAAASRAYNRMMGAKLAGLKRNNTEQRTRDESDCVDSESCQ